MSCKNANLFYTKWVSFIIVTKNRQNEFIQILDHSQKMKKKEWRIHLINGWDITISHDCIDFQNKEPDFSAGHAFNKGILIAKSKQNLKSF